MGEGADGSEGGANMQQEQRLVTGKQTQVIGMKQVIPYVSGDEVQS